MWIDGAAAVIYEETNLRQAAAALYKLPDIRRCRRYASTLECEVRSTAACYFFHTTNLFIQVFIVLEVHCIFSSKALCHLQTLLIAIYYRDVFHTHGSDHSQKHQTDRTNALNQYIRIEGDQTGCLRSLHRMHYNRCRLDQKTKLQAHIIDLKEGGAFTNHQVVRKPAIKMIMIVFGHQAIDAGIFAQIIAVAHVQAGIAMSAGNGAGHDAVSYCQRLTRGVHGDILTHLHNHTAALMSQHDRDETKRIVLILMNVRTADTAAFYLHKHLVIADLRDVKLLNLNLAQSGKHRHTSLLRNLKLCGSGGLSRLAGCSLHL